MLQMYWMNLFVSLLKAQLFFSRLEKLIFTLQVTYEQFDTSFFFPSIKRLHPFRKGEFLFFNLNFNQIYFSEAHVHHHLTGYNKLDIKKQWHQMTLRKKKWLRKNCERETIVIPLCKDVASATEWSLTPQKCPLSGQGST